MKVTDMLLGTLSPEEFIGFVKGNAIWYMAEDDFQKSIKFLELALKAKEPEEPEEPEQAEEPKVEEPKEEKPKEPKRVDHGKIIALYKGHWPVKEIALEMGISEQTVRNHIKQEVNKSIAEHQVEKEEEA